MASIDSYKTRDGKTMWRVRVQKNGQKRVATFPNYVDAKEWGQITEARVIEEQYLPHRHQKPAQHTLADAIQRYMDEILIWKQDLRTLPHSL